MTVTLDKHAFSRAQAYRLLSDCYYAPNDDFVSKTAAPADEAGPGFQPLRSCLRPPVDLQSLKQDYARLFIGPFKTLAPPYGSVYLEQEARLMGASTVDATAWYSEDGLTNTLREPPDHIIIEFEYLSFLACQIGIAESNGEADRARRLAERESGFLSAHLARWAPAFCHNVITHAQTSFYRILAETTHTFVGLACATPVSRARVAARAEGLDKEERDGRASDTNNDAVGKLGLVSTCV